MFYGFTIMFREALEIALIISIILSFLRRTNASSQNYLVYFGILAGIIISILSAYLLSIFKIGFTGEAKEIFEGVTMLLGAILIISMVIWMRKQKKIAEKFHEKIQSHLDSANKFGLFLLVFISMLREGLETVIFLSASNSDKLMNLIYGSILGLISAGLIGYLTYRATFKINMKYLFNITSIILILFAADMVIEGLEEILKIV